MNEILDDNYLDQFGELKITSEGTGLLYVDMDKWEDELIRLERQENIGCVILWVITFFVLYIPFNFDYRIAFLSTMALSGITYKAFTFQRFKNLKNHAHYQYEIYTDRVVRYSDRSYQKVFFAEAVTIKQQSFGIIVVQKRHPLNFFLYFLNPRLIVIPNKVQGYKQIVGFIKEISQKQKKPLQKSIYKGFSTRSGNRTRTPSTGTGF